MYAYVFMCVNDSVMDFELCVIEVHTLIYSLSHALVRMFFAYIIGLPGHRTKRISVLEITKIIKLLNKK